MVSISRFWKRFRELLPSVLRITRYHQFSNSPRSTVVRFRSKICALTLALVASHCVSLSQSSPAPNNSQPDTMTRQEVIDIVAATRKIVSPNGVEDLIPVQ